MVKRRGLVLALAICLCLSAACGAPAATPEETAAPTPTPAADSAEETAEDFTALRAEECVEDAGESPGTLPRIVLDCPGADDINRRISDQFAPLADDEVCEGVRYECCKGAGRVLTVLMIEQWPNDCVYYTPFCLDLATGQALDGATLLALLGVDPADLADTEAAVLGRTFEEQFAAMKEFMDDTSFYEEQYARTTAPENVELEKVWLDGDGQLCFAGRVYGLAGAEFYEYLLGTDMVF